MSVQEALTYDIIDAVIKLPRRFDSHTTNEDDDTTIPQSVSCLRDCCVNKSIEGIVESSLMDNLCHWMNRMN